MTIARTTQWLWLLGGLALAFAVPFVFADVLAVDRDVYYAVYILSVVALVFGRARSTKMDVRGTAGRNWGWGVGLGAVFAALLTLMVVRTEDATAHPHGFGFVAAIVWRGVVYGLTDGVLLSVFPVLAVFAAFAAKPLLRRVRGKVVVGALAMSLGFTAVYHLGYPEFRGELLRKPVAGDVLWSVPTLATLSPIGAPVAHAGLHVSAVVHSYETETFLPPHSNGE